MQMRECQEYINLKILVEYSPDLISIRKVKINLNFSNANERKLSQY